MRYLLVSVVNMLGRPFRLAEAFSNVVSPSGQVSIAAVRTAHSRVGLSDGFSDLSMFWLLLRGGDAGEAHLLGQMPVLTVVLGSDGSKSAFASELGASGLNKVTLVEVLSALVRRISRETAVVNLGARFCFVVHWHGRITGKVFVLVDGGGMVFENVMLRPSSGRLFACGARGRRGRDFSGTLYSSRLGRCDRDGRCLVDVIFEFIKLFIFVLTKLRADNDGLSL